MSANGKNKFSEAELDSIRESNQLSVLLEQFGIKLRKAGRGEWVGLSPFNRERTPSFTVNDEKGFYHCFSSGQHGDVFDAVMHFKGVTFPDAVDFLGGVREITAEDRARLAQKRRERTEEEIRERNTKRARARDIFGMAQPILKTHAAAYLAARGLTVSRSWTFDLRFAPALPYWGLADADAQSSTELGAFPAMLAAVRDLNGEMIGVHRTYLDPVEPRKLTPPGAPGRNAAKKISGDVSGGMIMLSEMRSRLAMGEGIETSQSWFAMGFGGDDIAIAAAVSLGNMAGAAVASRPHPVYPGKWIPNGVPDMERPGVVLPDTVNEVILLMDGDSDPANTRMQIVVAGRRFQKQGRAVFVSRAPEGKDFNDLLQEGEVAA